jgi:sugar/nucleoside kinase (ribokinase family)
MAGHTHNYYDCTFQQVHLCIPQGAGDAFVGALAGYLATVLDGSESKKGEWLPVPPGTLGDLLRKAAAVASHSVTSRGTQTSYVVDKLDKELLILSHSQP